MAPGATRSSAGFNWRWPADGSLGKRYQSGDAIPGIEILGKSGDPIRAAADGVVVYSGNGLVGYGEIGSTLGKVAGRSTVSRAAPVRGRRKMDAFRTSGGAPPAGTPTTSTLRDPRRRAGSAASRA